MIRSNRSFILCLILSVSALLSDAAEIRYPVSEINPVLLKNAGMVIRKHEVVLEIKSLNSETMTIRHVVTILKGSAVEEGAFRVMYDNFRSVDEFKGTMYDASGKVIRHFGPKDITDMAATSEGILYSDDRMKVIRPVPGLLPVTLEYSVRLTIKRILLYPAFRPQNEYEQSVENSSLEILAAEDCFPRYLEVRLPEGTIISGDGKSRKKWEFRDITARTEDCRSPSLEALTPVIYVNPAVYSIKGYKGDFSTWQSFGLWIRSLNEGQDSLPPAIASRTRELVAGIVLPEDKARKIYQHLQRTTRYVAVELGIGGLQSEPAATVARLGYGDCKGLVYYMSAMLKAAGIVSFPVLIHAGEDAEPIRADFPGNQFNHVILCVPLGGDTAWLECTSQTIPFGFLGSFTDDREALLVAPEGGKLVRTPGYKSNENRVSRKIMMKIDSAGSAVIRVNGRYRGLMFESVNAMIYLSPEKQREEIIERYSLPGLKVQSYSCNQEDEKIPCLTENIGLRISNYGSVNSNRVFIPSAALFRSLRPCDENEIRESDIEIPYGYCISDSIIIDLPSGYHVESSPPDLTLPGICGKLNCTVVPGTSSLLYIRQLEMEKGRYPASSFAEINSFITRINKQDQRKFVLLKN